LEVPADKKLSLIQSTINLINNYPYEAEGKKYSRYVEYLKTLEEHYNQIKNAANDSMIAVNYNTLIDDYMTFNVLDQLAFINLRRFRDDFAVHHLERYKNVKVCLDQMIAEGTIDTAFARKIWMLG